MLRSRCFASAIQLARSISRLDVGSQPLARIHPSHLRLPSTQTQLRSFHGASRMSGQTAETTNGPPVAMQVAASEVNASIQAAPSSPSEPDAKRTKLNPQATTNNSSTPVNGEPSSSAAAATPKPGPKPDLKTKAEAAFAKAQATRLKNKRKAYQASIDKKGGLPEPITHDILALLGPKRVAQLERDGHEWEARYEVGEEVVVEVERLSAHGDGLGVVRSRAGAGEEDGEGDTNTWVMAVPRALVGETVRVRVTENDRMFTRGTIVEHVSDFRAPNRRDDLVRCRYFDTCSGCQYQMLDYDEQLSIKQGVVEKAFALYSDLTPDRIPAVLPTMPSPSQYAYRTKLTPHFELPPIVRQLMRPKRRRGGGSLSHGAKEKIKAQAAALELDDEDRAHVDEQLKIGFHKAGKGHVIDIEECTIATPTLNKAMGLERQRVKDAIFSYQNGATLLLRDSLQDFGPSLPEGPQASGLAGSESADGEGNICVTVTNHKQVVLERVGSTKFESPAGTFFQNNRSILPDLIGYVRDEVNTFWNPAASSNSAGRGADSTKRYLVDAYCGSGLFALCLAPTFDQVSGVEISVDSIKFAERNAELNGLSKEKVRFLAGKAEDIFATVAYPPEQTTLIIDPPRKGCDLAFIKQLIALGPALVIYVSCNVHTQARDVGQILRLDPSYTISSIRGADLFPQTHHVEGVCVLRKKGATGKPKSEEAS